MKGSVLHQGAMKAKGSLMPGKELNRRPRERHSGLVVILQVREGEEKGETLRGGNPLPRGTLKAFSL